MNNLVDYHDLHAQRDTLLLVDEYENLGDMCLNTFDVYQAPFYAETGLAWTAVLAMIKDNLELLIVITLLLMVEKRINLVIIKI